MVTKFNILIDGGFFDSRFRKLNPGKTPTVQDVEQLVKDVTASLKAKSAGETEDILFRVFYYDCRPFSGTVPDHANPRKKTDYSKTRSYPIKVKYLEDIAKLERFALRLGELSFTGWKQDVAGKWKPDFKQRSVDMKFGLDIATMATKHTVDKIVLVAGDSDFIAPIKMARKEGLWIYLYPMGNHLKPALVEHCDFILK